jgi:hypothetical protein
VRALVFLAILLGPSAARAEAPPLTHTSPLTPTGALVPAGHLERTQSVVAFYHELAIGLTDGLEVRLGSPILPVPIFGGDLQLRASLLPASSPAKLVIGAGAVVEWVNGTDLWGSASLTAAWRGLHATVRGFEHEGEDDRILVTTIGAMGRLGRWTTVFVEVGDLAWLRPGACRDKHGDPVGCTTMRGGRGALFGAWWDVRSMWFGLSAAVVSSGGTTLPLVPLLSMRWDHDL